MILLITIIILLLLPELFVSGRSMWLTYLHRDSGGYDITTYQLVDQVLSRDVKWYKKGICLFTYLLLVPSTVLSVYLSIIIGLICNGNKRTMIWESILSVSGIYAINDYIEDEQRMASNDKNAI